MSRPALRGRMKSLTQPGVTLALAAAVAAGLAVGPGLTYPHFRLPQTVQLGTLPVGGSGSGTAVGVTTGRSPSAPPDGAALAQPTEPVETVKPEGSVVTLPSQDGGGGDQQKSSQCSSTSDQSCKTSGGG